MSETTTDSTIQETAGETSADTSTDVESTQGATEDNGTAEVRDPAKLLSAYEAEKAKRREQDKAMRELRTEFDALRAKAEGREAEFVAAQETQRVKDEAIAAANRRILNSEVKAAAKGVLADPQDAYRFLDLDSFEVDSDGNVDEGAIQAALNDLVTQKPYLSAQGGQRFQGSTDGGARNDAAKPAQLSEADMARMTPEQIAQAHDDGRFDDLLGNR